METLNEITNEFINSFRNFAFDTFLDESYIDDEENDDDDAGYFNDLTKDARGMDHMIKNEYFTEIFEYFFEDMPNDSSRKFIAYLIAREIEKVKNDELRKRLVDKYGKNEIYGLSKYLNGFLERPFYGKEYPNGKWLATNGVDIIRRIIRHCFSQRINVSPKVFGENDGFRIINNGGWSDPEFLFHGIMHNYWDIMDGITDEDGKEKEIDDITDEDITNELLCSESCGCGYLPKD